MGIFVYILARVVLAIVAIAIGRGIVMAFGLDVRIARMINAATTSKALSGVAWMVGGTLGLLVIVGCRFNTARDK
jgi:hypothetical protein